MDVGNWFLQTRDALVAKGQAAVDNMINTPANPVTANPIPSQPVNLSALTKNPTMLLIGAVVLVVVVVFMLKKKGG